MKLTKNYKLKKPEPSDFIDVETDFHETLDTVDTELKKHADALAGVKKTWRVALPAAAWTSTFPYSQTVTVPDMKADYTPIWGVLNEESTEARAKQVARVQLKSVITQNGSIRVSCMKRPAVDIVLLGEGV